MRLSVAYHWTKGLLLLALVFTSSVQAEERSANNQWRWHGFANLGTVKTDNNSFFGDSKDWSSDFHDLGLGGSWKPSSRLQVSAQAIYRRAGKTSYDGLQLDYGFLDFNILNSMEYGLGVRAGRVKNPYGLYNETRDIASSRPSILLPQSIYLDSLRQLFHTMDGLSSYGHIQWGDSLLNLDLVYGKPQIDETTEAVILNIPRPGDITDEKMLLARAMFEQDAGRWRLGYSFAKLNSDYDAAAIDFSVDGEANIQLHLLSFEYNWEKWQITAEHQWREIEYQDINYVGYDSTTDSRSYYGQASYQFLPKWKTYARYDVYYLFDDDKNGKQLEADTGLPVHEAFTKDLTVGIRYDINKNWMVAAEIHQIQGTAWLARIENPTPSQTEEDWNLFSAQISFKF